jgi:anti-sigma factor RsiW
MDVSLLRRGDRRGAFAMRKGQIAPISCQEIVELITEYLEGTLSPVDRARFEHHLDRCDGCDAYVEQMRETVAALGHLPPESLSPRFEAGGV